MYNEVERSPARQRAIVMTALCTDVLTASARHANRSVLLRPRGKCPRLSTGNKVCIDWMHLAAQSTSTDVNQASAFAFCGPAVLTEQFVTSDNSLNTEHFQTETDNASHRSATNIIRRRCDVSVILAMLYKCQNLVTDLTVLRYRQTAFIK